jgi:hypothetical protein
LALENPVQPRPGLIASPAIACLTAPTAPDPRRIFSRFDKLDVLFLGFIMEALIFDALR